MKLADLFPKSLQQDAQDAIALLEADHQMVLGLFEHFEDIRESHADKEKQEIVANICHELTVHITIEEEVFYPAVRRAVDDEDLMNEALVEHEGAKSLIRDLEEMDAGDAMFNAKVTVLAEYIKHHVKEERDELFPKVRSTSVDLKALGQKMLAHKAQLKNGGAKAAPKSRPAGRKPASGTGRSTRRASA